MEKNKCPFCDYGEEMINITYWDNGNVKSYICPNCRSKIKISEDCRVRFINSPSHQGTWCLFFCHLHVLACWEAMYYRAILGLDF